MVPKGWKKGLVSDLANTVMGYAFKSSDFVEDGIPLVRMGNLYQNQFQLDRSPIYLPDNFAAEYKRFLLKSGDLVMSMTGTMGKKDYGFAVEIPEKTQDCLLNQRVLKIEPINSDAKGFVLNLLKSEIFLSRLYSLPGGTKQANLSATQIREISVLIPPLPEQKKIAKILTTWDKAISTTERLIDNSQQQKKALMQQLLTGKQRLLDDSGERFSGEWEEIKLKSVLDLMRSGLSRKLENENVGIAVIRSNNMGPKYTTNLDIKYWYLEDPQGANVANYILEEGDLLVNFINSISQIGKACIYKKFDNTDAIYTTNILRIKANTSVIDSTFLYLLTQTAGYDSYIQAITKPAVNQASFTTKEFGEFKFELPSLKEQQKIATVLTNADREIELLQQQLADLQQEKRALMQQLLTGKKRVVV